MSYCQGCADAENEAIKLRKQIAWQKAVEEKEWGCPETLDCFGVDGEKGKINETK